MGRPRYRDGWRNAEVADGAPKLFTFTRFPKSQWKSSAIVVRLTRHAGLREEFKRRIKTRIVLPPERVEGGGNRRDGVLGFACVTANNHPQDRRLAKPRRNAL
jgi:hypothetical protein